MSFASRIIDNQSMPRTGVEETSATQEFALGTILKMDDGRVFRYAKAGAVSLMKGKMVQAPAVVSEYTSASGLLATTVSTTAKTLVLSRTTVPSSKAIIADQYKDGFLLAQDKAFSRRIVGNEALGKTTTAVTTTSMAKMTLESGMPSSLATTDKISLVANPYNGVIVAPSGGTTARAVGVPLVAVTANQYCWLQVRGESPLLVDSGASVAVGEWIGEPASASVDGGGGLIIDVTSGTAVDAKRPAWGVVLASAGGGSYALVSLTME